MSQEEKTQGENIIKGENLRHDVHSGQIEGVADQEAAPWAGEAGLKDRGTNHGWRRAGT